MKTLKNILLVLAVLTPMFFSACKKKTHPPQKTPQEQQIEWLTGTWTVQAVTLDNADVTAEWSGFSLQFGSDQSYVATALSDESVLVWPPQGSYSFPEADNAAKLLRNDDIQITVSNASETTASLSFHIAGRNGRAASLIGQWNFEMVK